MSFRNFTRAVAYPRPCFSGAVARPASSIMSLTLSPSADLNMALNFVSISVSLCMGIEDVCPRQVRHGTHRRKQANLAQLGGLERVEQRSNINDQRVGPLLSRFATVDGIPVVNVAAAAERKEHSIRTTPDWSRHGLW